MTKNSRDQGEANSPAPKKTTTNNDDHNIVLPPSLQLLTTYPFWVCWRWVDEVVDEKTGVVTKLDKPTKSPFQCNGRKASTSNPKTWTTYDRVVAAVATGKFDGIGFVLTNAPFGAFDLDHCRDPQSGLIEPWAKNLVEDCHTYTEITPSQTGLRIIGHANGGEIHRKLAVPNANGMHCELYRKATRFITVTGHAYDDRPLANIDARLDAVLTELEAAKNKSKTSDNSGGAQLSRHLSLMLHFPNLGKGKRHGEYLTRNELTFGFITLARKAFVSDHDITLALGNEEFKGNAIYEHCQDNGGLDYIRRQLQHADKFQSAAPAVISATSVKWRDPSQIPQREWLYYPYYIRGSVTGTAASGGTGKSTLGISETMSMASGRPLLGTEPAAQLRVWYWNGEETEAELERKLAAVRILHDLAPEDFGNRLFVNSGLLMPIVIAETSRGDTKICNPVVDQVIATLKENQIDVMILDPFVSTRRVSEQDNDDIDMVVKKWMAIAVAANCAIHIFGHTRKNLNEYVTADDARGASAFKDALRCLRVLNPMTGKEAEKADIDEDERGSYFRADNGKKNLTPVASAHWYKLQSVNLGNGLVHIPGVPTVGDAVGVATPWEYPSLGDDIGPEQVTLGLEAVGSGGPWRLDQRSKAQTWVGVPIATALGFDLEKRVDKDTVVNLIKKWITAGWLVKVPGQDTHGKDREYVEVVRVVGERVTSPDRQSTP